MLYAADAGIELAARELARRADWNAGADRRATLSTFTDGAAGGVREHSRRRHRRSHGGHEHVELRQGRPTAPPRR